MSRTHVPVPERMQVALSQWLAAHLDELGAITRIWDLPPEVLTVPTWTYTVDTEEEEMSE